MLLETEDPRLVAIAGAIAEGSAVDWTAESTHPPSTDHALFGELQAVERIVAAHRDVGTGVSVDTRALNPDLRDHGRWSHLTIREQIGRGSFGVVYRAHDPRLATDVALKLAPSGAGARSLWVPSVLKEAQLLARVRHPNVVSVYGADEVDGRVGIWMELVVGRTLEQILETQGPSSAREAALVGLDVARAVAAVHRVGLVHGDIKSANVMRAAGGRTLLMDFGTSHDARADGRREIGFRGTPVYVAPEVFAGGVQNQASDVYAMGILLFHLVTGEYPVIAHHRDEIARMHERGERRQLRDVRPDLPDEFIRVIDRAISPRVDERYRSPGELEAALARFIDPSVPVAAARTGGWRRYGAVIAVLGALAVGGWLSFRSGAVSGAPYEIEAAFYRSTGTNDERLAEGQRLALGDRLSFALETSVPAYLYIVNEPDQGQPFLLFPLPGQSLHNPLPSGARLRVPEGVDWQVTSAGGRERFVVFVSPQRVDAFEQVFANLPSPRVGEPVLSAPLPVEALERLRGVGGLSPSRTAPAGVPRFSTLFATPLTGRRETANGLWVRQLTLDSPPP